MLPHKEMSVFGLETEILIFFFFSSRRRHTRSDRDWSSDVCSSDLGGDEALGRRLGYRWNYGFRVKQLRDGKFGISLAKLKLLSDSASVSMDDVLQHGQSTLVARARLRVKQ